MKLFNVFVAKGEESDFMVINAHNAREAKNNTIEFFYFDGWHVTKVEEL